MHKIALFVGGIMLSALLVVPLASCGTSGVSMGAMAQGCGAAALTPTVTATDTGSTDSGSITTDDTPTAIVTAVPCFGVPAIVVPITPAKVIAYVSSHPLQRNQAETHISAIKVQEFAASDAPLLLQGDSVVASGPNIWYAELQGQFLFGGPVGSDNTSMYQYGFEIFDDTTGNSLASGGRVAPICDYSTADMVCQPVIPITPVATPTI